MNKTQLLESLKQKGFSKQILDAFSKVERENFFPSESKEYAYLDEPFPIGYGQTISQPYTIAMMLNLLKLKPNQKVLEVGSGSGYVLALINTITKSKVYGVEIIKELAEQSKRMLEDYDVEVFNKNGSDGLEEKALFDKILISAAIEEVPKKVLSQLKERGILVAPIGPKYEQSLIAIQRKNNKFIIIKQIPGFIFVRFVRD